MVAAPLISAPKAGKLCFVNYTGPLIPHRLNQTDADSVDAGSTISVGFGGRAGDGLMRALAALCARSGERTAGDGAAVRRAIFYGQRARPFRLGAVLALALSGAAELRPTNLPAANLSGSDRARRAARKRPVLLASVRAPAVRPAGPSTSLCPAGFPTARVTSADPNRGPSTGR